MAYKSTMFSLVFLTWNAGDCIGVTLETVADQTYDDFEVVVVDNDSDDDTLSVVAGYGDAFALTVVENNKNVGFSAGTNRGVRAANGEYICCYNHDTRFPPDYLTTLANTVTPNAVWTTARINYRTSRNHHCVRLLGWDRFPVPYVVDDLEGTAAVNYVPGDGLVVPRAVLERLDGPLFDPALPPKGEDLHLSLRLRQRGVPLRAVLDTHSVHPDEGQYNVTIGNLVDHLVNVGARMSAYRRTGGRLRDLAGVAASTATVPARILAGSIPRDDATFRQRTGVADAPASDP